MTNELNETTRIVNLPMAHIVYGPPPAPKRNWFWAAAVLGASLWGFSGCATAPRPADIETVGQLSPSTTHVYTAAVHATSDLTPAGFVVGGDDIAAPVAAAPEAEAPEIAPKASLVMGSVAR